jgi:hypothetical protein
MHAYPLGVLAPCALRKRAHAGPRVFRMLMAYLPYTAVCLHSDGVSLASTRQDVEGLTHQILLRHLLRCPRPLSRPRRP